MTFKRDTYRLLNRSTVACGWSISERYCIVRKVGVLMILKTEWGAAIVCTAKIWLQLYQLRRVDRSSRVLKKCEVWLSICHSYCSTIWVNNTDLCCFSHFKERRSPQCLTFSEKKRDIWIWIVFPLSKTLLWMIHSLSSSSSNANESHCDWLID